MVMPGVRLSAGWFVQTQCMSALLAQPRARQAGWVNSDSRHESLGADLRVQHAQGHSQLLQHAGATR